MKKLTKTELLQSELYSEQKKVRSLEKTVLELSAQIHDLQFQIKKKEHEMNMKLRQENISNKKSQNVLLDKDHKEFNNKLKTKYKIKGSFGIDPDTGKITEE